MLRSITSRSCVPAGGTINTTGRLLFQYRLSPRKRRRTSYRARLSAGTSRLTTTATSATPSCRTCCGVSHADSAMMQAMGRKSLVRTPMRQSHNWGKKRLSYLHKLQFSGLNCQRKRKNRRHPEGKIQASVKEDICPQTTGSNCNLGRAEYVPHYGHG